jgi:hypothetical protein
MIGHPAREVLQGELLLEVIGLFRSASLQLLCYEHIGDGRLMP